MKLDKIGIWSEIKLDIIKEYANAFTKIMKSQEWCKGYVYIDAFAGPGVHLSRRTGEFIMGSPLNALEIDNPFTEYHYIDIDKEKAETLDRLTGDRTNVNIYQEDCNEILTEKILPSLPYKSYKRALCILDPYGLHLNWKTIITAAQQRTTEIFLNFGSGSLWIINKLTCLSGYAMFISWLNNPKRKNVPPILICWLPV